MVTLQKIEQFRLSREPISTLWHLHGEQAYGSLCWRNGRAELSLCISTPLTTIMIESDIDPIIIELTKPPQRSCIAGHVYRYGWITLIDSMQYNIKKFHNYKDGVITYHVDFLPRSVFIGSRIERVESQVLFVEARDVRLVGYLDHPGIKTYSSWDDEAKAAFDALGSPDELWALQKPFDKEIILKGTPFLLSIRNAVSSSRSSTNGINLQSEMKICLRSEMPTTIEEASVALSHLEQIFSVFALEPFSFQLEEFFTKNGLESLALVWHLGENREGFHPPMRHQILLDFTNRETVETICDSWFNAPEAVKVSRWLFSRALQETESGLSRFVAVAQAFEVLGRELVSSSKKPKSEINNALDMVKSALEGKFDEEFIIRIISLISSSNKASFRDTLYAMLAAASPDPKHELHEFCRRVSKTRNTVVHMTTNSQSELNDAFKNVNKLSLQLCFWYAVVQAHYLGIKIPNLTQFLFNNRNARHGLPNEVLEKL